MMTGVGLSVCLSVACFDLTRQMERLRNPKLARWKHITRVSREPVRDQKVKGQGHHAD